MDTPDEIPDPVSSFREIQEFVETSFIWRDLRTYLEWRRKAVLEQIKGVDSMQRLGHLQGSLELLDDVLELPDLLLRIQDLNEPVDDDAE